MKIKNNYQRIFYASAKGQSMVEALIALTAAVIIISSITVAVVTSVNNTSYSSNQNKATQLAREGLEAARQLRDTNYEAFGKTEGEFCYPENQVDFIEGSTSICKNHLNIDNAYSRIVEFILPNADGNTCGAVTQVTSTVSWADSKCPPNNQICRNVKLVSCLSATNVTSQSFTQANGGDEVEPPTPTPNPIPIPIPTPTPTPMPNSTPIQTPIQTPTPTPIPTPTPVPITYGTVQTSVHCGTGSNTPDQVCQRSGYARAVTGGGTAARGYWWRQCGGASVSSCSGISCTVRALDCTNIAGYWGSQNPLSSGASYPAAYQKAGLNSTVYNPLEFEGLNCSLFNPGWTMRVNCQSP